MLYIVYKQGITMSNKRATIEQKNENINRKKEIQKSIWKKLGIKVDKVVQSKGTSLWILWIILVLSTKNF